MKGVRARVWRESGSGVETRRPESGAELNEIGDSRTAAEEFALANDLAACGDWEASTDAYQRAAAAAARQASDGVCAVASAIARRPDSSLDNHVRAKESAEYFQLALSLCKESGEAIYGFALTQAQSGRPTQASELIKAVANFDPSRERLLRSVIAVLALAPEERPYSGDLLEPVDLTASDLAAVFASLRRKIEGYAGRDYSFYRLTGDGTLDEAVLPAALGHPAALGREAARELLPVIMRLAAYYEDDDRVGGRSKVRHEGQSFFIRADFPPEDFAEAVLGQGASLTGNRVTTLVDLLCERARFFRETDPEGQQSSTALDTLEGLLRFWDRGGDDVWMREGRRGRTDDARYLAGYWILQKAPDPIPGSLLLWAVCALDESSITTLLIPRLIGKYVHTTECINGLAALDRPDVDAALLAFLPATHEMSETLYLKYAASDDAANVMAHSTWAITRLLSERKGGKDATRAVHKLLSDAHDWEMRKEFRLASLTRGLITKDILEKVMLDPHSHWVSGHSFTEIAELILDEFGERGALALLDRDDADIASRVFTWWRRDPSEGAILDRLLSSRSVKVRALALFTPPHGKQYSPEEHRLLEAIILPRLAYDTTATITSKVREVRNSLGGDRNF